MGLGCADLQVSGFVDGIRLLRRAQADQEQLLNVVDGEFPVVIGGLVCGANRYLAERGSES